MNVENSLFEPTSEDVPSEADDVLRSDKGVYRVVD
jgi:hypothetical protein